ncbi:MAG: hypothetical protein MUF86_07980 [Akkermansiaceae bacterium]|nr:hypothetical protein [Akkermansiaceae bacterium]
MPATIMPLRYAYEGMIVSQAVRNPFEVERIRLQRRIDRGRDIGENMNERAVEQFELAKEGLRRLLAAGASDKKEAADIVERIRRISASGTRIEVETMKVWPENDPASEFFVNERIDLLVREAETFRNDYRNTENRVVFHALKKPIPFIAGQPVAGAVFTEPEGHMETQRYCGVILGLFITGCMILSTFIIHRQNRMTR